MGSQGLPGQSQRVLAGLAEDSWLRHTLNFRAHLLHTRASTFVSLSWMDTEPDIHILEKLRAQPCQYPNLSCAGSVNQGQPNILDGSYLTWALKTTQLLVMMFTTY